MELNKDKSSRVVLFEKFCLRTAISSILLQQIYECDCVRLPNYNRWLIFSDSKFRIKFLLEDGFRLFIRSDVTKLIKNELNLSSHPLIIIKDIVSKEICLKFESEKLHHVNILGLAIIPDLEILEERLKFRSYEQ